MTPAALFAPLAVVTVSFEALVAAAAFRGGGILARGARQVSSILRFP
jgi:hypothetical protein